MTFEDKDIDIIDRRNRVVRALVENLSSAESEAAISTLPFGKMNHLLTSSLSEHWTEASAATDKNIVDLKTLTDKHLRMEAIIGNHRNFLPASFLTLGAQCQRSVGRLRLTRDYDSHPAGSGYATGFLISRSLFITNYHVAATPDLAASTFRVQFNFQYDNSGALSQIDEYDFDPSGVFYSNAHLDFSILRLKPSSSSAAAPPIPSDVQWPGDTWGSVAMNANVKFAEGQGLNIVQHPDGRPKEVAIRDSILKDPGAEFIKYTTDTEPGSSGSPVFNNAWQLIALHRSAGDEAPSGKYENNVGVRMDRIIADIVSNAPAIATELGLQK